MDRIEEKLDAIKTINETLKSHDVHTGNIICEQIVDALIVRGWRGPAETRWIKEMVFDQARMSPGANPYKEKTNV